jgi:cyanate lyase
MSLGITPKGQLATAICARCEEKGLTFKELAEQTCQTREFMRHVLKMSVFPNIFLIRQLAYVLDMDEGQLKMLATTDRTCHEVGLDSYKLKSA